MSKKNHTLEVWGDLACFTRPEMKVERFSYPVITPSAARGIFDAIYWEGIRDPNGMKPYFHWQIERIEVLEMPRYLALRRNEVKGIVPGTAKMNKWMRDEETPEPLMADSDDPTTGRTQRQTMALKNVRYRLTARIIPKPQFSAPEQINKFDSMFERRAKQGKCFLQPFFGCSEFPAFFEYVQPGEERQQPAAFDQHIGWMKWCIAGADPLQQSEVLEWWRGWRDADQTKGKVEEKPKKGKSGEQLFPDTVSAGIVCFLSGEALEPVATQPKIGGLSGVGGLGTGDVIAGFDKSAFCSFGLEQARNAAMGEKPVREYVDALNHLIKNHSRKLANALVVHWFKDPIPQENDPLWFLSEPPELTEGAAQQSARQILAALRKGERPIPANNRYYALTLSGASGRVMIRDWMEGSFEELVARIEQWFTDLEIVARDGGNAAHDPKFMAVCGSIMRDLKDLPAPTAATLWRVALSGLPIPQPIIAQAMARFRADLIDDKPFSHARMGLIKAYFIRKGDQQMSAYLNKEHPEPAYQCGRLLAVLAGLQRAALGDVGAGVVQRYYVAASQTPGLTLGRLVGNAKNHLNKLDGGLTYWYEGEIAEIMSHIQDRIPSTLNLDQQSLFALGYYQQIAANRAGKNNDTNETTKGENQ